MKVPTLVRTRVQTPDMTEGYSRSSASPADFGAALAPALASLGAQLKEREDKTNRFTALKELNDFETRVNARLVEEQRNAAPNGQGFLEQASDFYTREENDFLARISPELQEEFSYRTSQVRQGVAAKALDFQYKAGDAFFRQGLSDIYDKARSAIDPRTGGNPQDLELWKERLVEAANETDLAEVEKNELLWKMTQGLEGVGYRAAVKAGGMAMDETVGGAIDRAAAAHGEDADTLRTIAWLESRGDPTAKNPNSSAGGLFQFIDGTAQNYGLKNKFDADESADAGARLLKDNRNALTKALGRNPSKGELYLAHQQGAQGAIDLLANPNMLAATIVGSEAVRLNGGNVNMTAQEFANLWINKAESVGDVDLDQRYANVPYEDRIALRNDAIRERTAEEAAERKQRETIYESNLNSILTAIHDGGAGQVDIDAFRDANPGMDYADITKMDQALKTYGETVGLASTGWGRIAEGGIFDPTSDQDRKMLNAMVGKDGLASLQGMSPGFVTDTLVPMVTKAGDIPTDVMGMLTGMLRSNNQSQAMFALDTLAQLRDAEPRAFAARANEAMERDVSYWTSRRNLVPHDELIKQLNPGVDQTERQARAVLRKQGEEALTKKEQGVPALDTLVGQFIDRYDGWLSSARTASVPYAAQALQQEFQSAFLDEYERYGNAEEASEAAMELLKKSWAMTSVGDPILMKYAPEAAGYRPYNGGFDWITEQVREENGLAPDTQFQLISDDRTAEEVERFRANPDAQPPSYRIAVKDPGGFYRMLDQRQFFRVKEETIARDRKELNVRNDLAGVEQRLNELTRAATAAAARKQRLTPEEEAEYEALAERWRALQDYNPETGEFGRPAPEPEVRKEYDGLLRQRMGSYFSMESN